MKKDIQGLNKLKKILKTLPFLPGVYRMIDQNGQVLYVGKALNLQKRVASYTHFERLSPRLQHMVSQIDHVEVITTHTESDALLLENNLIKSYSPPYNILFKDDKSFPYILIRGDHPYPQILKYRGDKSKKGYYFGPFASTSSVHETLTILQKAFLIRSCSDTVFTNRKRPCLLYQIKRCSAPCVNYISKEEYEKLVQEAVLFLKGQSRKIQEDLALKMHEASEKLDYETARVYRDRIRALSSIQAHQSIHTHNGTEEADVIAVITSIQLSCVQLFFYRQNQNLGNSAFFFKHREEVLPEEVISAFISQFYEERLPPKEIILSHMTDESLILKEALSQKLGRQVKLTCPKLGHKKELVEHALKNAIEALDRKRLEHQNQEDLFQALADRFQLESIPNIIEIYDNSHISGTNAIGAMVVADPTGFLKNRYRKFNVGLSQDFSPGDDYAMMREVFKRRFERLLKEDPDYSKNLWPDLVFIDGGLGQLQTVKKTLDDLGVMDITLIAIAKGKERHKGREQFFMIDRPVFKFEANDPVLYFVQRLRDEAHRFAVGSHRQKRESSFTRSELDAIPGIGPKRKKALLLHFGSVKEILKASVEDLRKVKGISLDLAKELHRFFQKR